MGQRTVQYLLRHWRSGQYRCRVSDRYGHELLFESFAAALLCYAVSRNAVHAVFLFAGEGEMDRYCRCGDSAVFLSCITPFGQGCAYFFAAALFPVLWEGCVAGDENGMEAAAMAHQSKKVIKIKKCTQISYTGDSKKAL